MSEQSNETVVVTGDFIPLGTLSKLLHTKPKTLYNQHASRSGPLASILTKLGGRLGCWREDYEAWKAKQRRLRPEGASLVAAGTVPVAPAAMAPVATAACNHRPASRRPSGASRRTGRQ